MLELEVLRVRCLHMLVQVEDLVERLRTDTAIVDVLLFFNSFPLVLRRNGTPAIVDTCCWSKRSERYTADPACKVSDFVH